MKNREININGMTYGERELAQLICRRMITRSMKNLKKYNRKLKHKKLYEDSY